VVLVVVIGNCDGDGDGDGDGVLAGRQAALRVGPSDAYGMATGEACGVQCAEWRGESRLIEQRWRPRLG